MGPHPGVTTAVILLIRYYSIMMIAYFVRVQSIQKVVARGHSIPNSSQKTSKHCDSFQS